MHSKLLCLFISSLVFVVSCSDNRNRENLKQSCQTANLDLESYKIPNAEALSIPGKENKDNEGNPIPTIPAKNGKYVLNRAVIHIHDQNLESRVKDDKMLFFQMSFGITPSAQQPSDVEENIQPFQSGINCLSGLKAEFAGKTLHEVTLPSTIEISGDGSEIELADLKTLNLGFYDDGLFKVKAQEDNNKGPIDNVDDINKTDTDPTSHFYRNTPETGEVYQFQHQVTQGKITISLIVEFSRCVSPEELENSDQITEEEKKAQQEAFDNCVARGVKINDLN